MNHRPLVSICIPTYNNARYLRECLDSIVSQTYRNIEVIIGDDASSDDTTVIAREYAARYGFRLHRNESNRGGGETSSLLVRLARGEYVAIYHSDDRYEPDIVEESVKALNTDPRLGLVGAMAYIIDDSGSRTGEFRLHDNLRRMNKKNYTFDEVMRGVLQNAGSDILLVTPSVMARKTVYDELGLYNAEKYRSAYDYEMWLRVAVKHPVAVIDKKMMNYRIHKNQISEMQIRKNIDVQDIVWVIRDYRQFISDLKVLQLCDSLLDRWIFRVAKRQNRLGLFEKSSATLNHVRSKKYLFLKWILAGLNAMRLSIK